MDMYKVLYAEFFLAMQKQESVRLILDNALRCCEVFFF